MNWMQQAATKRGFMLLEPEPTPTRDAVFYNQHHIEHLLNLDSLRLTEPEPVPRYQRTVTKEEWDALHAQVESFVAENELAALTLSRFSSDLAIAAKSPPSAHACLHGFRAEFDSFRVVLRDLRDRQKPLIGDLRFLALYNRTRVAPLWSKLATSINAVRTALDNCASIRGFHSVVYPQQPKPDGLD